MTSEHATAIGYVAEWRANCWCRTSCTLRLCDCCGEPGVLNEPEMRLQLDLHSGEVFFELGQVRLPSQSIGLWYVFRPWSLQRDG